MQLRTTPGILLLATLGFAASILTACGENAGDQASNDGSEDTDAAGPGDDAELTFNQCGVAAPLPADTGQCTAVSEPVLTDFDDFDGTEAASYTYYVGAEAPAGAVLGGVLHIGDGSDMNDEASVIATEMVTGADGDGYAVQVSNTNAMNWGGLLMFYFPSDASTTTCLDGGSYDGIAFSIKGASPSGRVGLSLGMLDTIPAADNGLCDNATSDCKNASIELELPVDAETWLEVRAPWDSLTPGVCSALSCVPVTGQNILHLVIQPFMNFPPPDYMFEPGAYTIAVDNLRFY
jgi:hypothetical protein